MPNLSIEMLYCVTAATGVDGAVNVAIARLAPTLPGAAAVEGIQKAVAQVPGLIQAIDQARQDPDNLYLTLGDARGSENAAWPGQRARLPMQGAQSTALNVEHEFAHSVNISLWDYDEFSDDDLLGSVTALAEEAGRGPIAKLATSPIEGSAYYVVYHVD